jgi:FdhD protein
LIEKRFEKKIVPKKVTSEFYRPQMSAAGLSPVHRVVALDQSGNPTELWIPGEAPLTIKVDNNEIVTLMTLGTHPEELALGYLRNQNLIENIEEINSVSVNWEKEVVNIITKHGKGIADFERKLSKLTVTSGCGQGTLFSCTIDKIYELRFPGTTVRQSAIYELLKKIIPYNKVYRQAGSVHGCGLCKDDQVIMFVEDVGRHNAADAIAGRMWLDRIPGEDKILFSTGRLTSEIVMKSAHMRIPVLLSRSGVTQMGLELALDLGITMIGRAKGKRLFVYNGGENITFDSRPQSRIAK